MNAYRLLRIYRAPSGAPSGQWAGRMIENGKEVVGIAGCTSADEVETAAHELGWEGFDVQRNDSNSATQTPGSTTMAQMTFSDAEYAGKRK
ncbi:MAG: hypothetical protein ABI379_01510 [Rhodanobacter sp.]